MSEPAERPRRVAAYDTGKAARVLAALPRRPSRDAAEAAIDAFLEKELGEVPSYEMHPDGDEGAEWQDPDKLGWQFWVRSSDTASYVRRDLSVEWYGTSWEPGEDEDALPAPA